MGPIDAWEVQMTRQAGLWVASPSFLAPMAFAATLSITLKNGRTVTYSMHVALTA